MEQQWPTTLWLVRHGQSAGNVAGAAAEAASLRSILDAIVREQSRERVLIVSHEVVVDCMRYLLEHMDERQVLAIDRAHDVPNCSVTSYEFDPAQGRHGKLVPRLVNFVAPLEVTGTPVTAEPDRPVAAKS